MKYSTDDIVQQNFERRFRGYDVDQVHEFLDLLAREWEIMTEEVLDLQTEVADLASECKELRARERGLLDALNTAREVSDEIISRAEARAERMILDATTRADELVAAGEREQAMLLGRNQELQRQRGRLERELRGVLFEHLRVLDESSVEPEDEYEIEEVAAADADAPEAIEDAGPTIHRRPRQTQPPSSPTAARHVVDEIGETRVVEIGETMLGMP
jgi:cell division initiation protein